MYRTTYEVPKSYVASCILVKNFVLIGPLQIMLVLFSALWSRLLELTAHLVMSLVIWMWWNEYATMAYLLIVVCYKLVYATVEVVTQYRMSSTYDRVMTSLAMYMYVHYIIMWLHIFVNYITLSLQLC